jgi:hypothetical protein
MVSQEPDFIVVGEKGCAGPPTARPRRRLRRIDDFAERGKALSAAV